MPHRRHPARDGGRRATSSTRPRASPRPTFPRGYRELLALPLRARRAPGPAPRRRATRSCAAPIVAGQPDLLAEVVDRRPPRAGALGRRRAPAPDPARPRSQPPQLRTAESVRPVAEALGAELGWDGARVGRRGRALARRRRGGGDRPGAPGALSRRRRRPATYPPRPMPRKLADLHLADLHRRAADAQVSGYRKLSREELIEVARERADAGDRRSARQADTDEADTDELPVVVGATVARRRSRASRSSSGAGDAEGGDERDEPTEEVRGVLEPTRQRLRLPAPGRARPRRGRRLRLGGADPPLRAAGGRRGRRPRARPPARRAPPRARPRRRRQRRRADAEERPEFDSLAPVLPERRIELGADADADGARGRPARPLAFGQRVLVRAAARSGRTTLLRSLARAAASDETARVDRPARRRAPRGGDGVAGADPGRRVRDRDRRLRPGRAGPDRRAGARARPPPRRGRRGRGPGLSTRSRGWRSRPGTRRRSSGCSAPGGTSRAAAR